jgi:hypothetical protein
MALSSVSLTLKQKNFVNSKIVINVISPGTHSLQYEFDV